MEGLAQRCWQSTITHEAQSSLSQGLRCAGVFAILTNSVATTTNPISKRCNARMPLTTVWGLALL